jgi:UDP-N-acetylmuramate dehydrogenase
MRLLSDLKVNMRMNEPLAQYTSFKIGGLAHFYAKPSNLTELLYVLKYQKREEMPLHILGGGSNTLFADSGFRGLVLDMSGFEKEFIVFEKNRVRVSAGALTHHFVTVLKKEGLGGLEFLSHLPGTVGGAVLMNAGFGKNDCGHRQEICNTLKELSFLTLGGDFGRLSKEEISFSYRSSGLDGKLILEAVFELMPRRPEVIQKTMDQNIKYRRAVQDWTNPSAGSVFKNPTAFEWTVGEMVDRLGLKGTQIGGAQISPIHANFIVNTGNACAQDVLELMQLMKGKVLEEFKAELEPEIKYVEN